MEWTDVFREAMRCHAIAQGRPKAKCGLRPNGMLSSSVVDQHGDDAASSVRSPNINPSDRRWCILTKGQARPALIETEALHEVALQSKIASLQIRHHDETRQFLEVRSAPSPLLRSRRHVDDTPRHACSMQWRQCHDLDHARTDLQLNESRIYCHMGSAGGRLIAEPHCASRTLEHNFRRRRPERSDQAAVNGKLTTLRSQPDAFCRQSSIETTGPGASTLGHPIHG